MRLSFILAHATLISIAASTAWADSGYLRDPSLCGTTVVFDDEQSIWRVSTEGGTAQRLTAPIGIDPHPILSPDGKQVAFLADFDGPTEIYVIPIDGGTPHRVTYENQSVTPFGWDRKAGILYSTAPEVGPGLSRIITGIHPVSGTKHVYPLADANDAALSTDGQWIYFIRFGTAVSDNHLRLYRGGAMAQLWRYHLRNGSEAERIGPQDANLRRPMLWQNRLIVISDQDGRDNLWSFSLDGTDGRQLTHHINFGVRQASLSGKSVVYQHGADLYRFDLDTNVQSRLSINLTSDHPARRPLWLDDTFRYLSTISLAPNGKQVVLTQRGRAIIAAPGPLRRVTMASASSTRLRYAALSPDSKQLYAFSDKGGEFELWAFPASGGGDGAPLTRGSKTEPMGLWISPSGSHIAHADINGHLYLTDLARHTDKLIDDARLEGQSGYDSVAWSPDGRALAFVRARGGNFRRQIALYALETGTLTWVTTPNYESFAPRFSLDGQFLWFLSDRLFTLSNNAPWGDRSPAPVFNQRTGVFALALQKAAQFPFSPQTELDPAPHVTRIEKSGSPTTPNQPAFDPDNLYKRLYRLAIPGGDFSKIEVGSEFLYLLTRKADQPAGKTDDQTLFSLNFAAGTTKLKEFATGLRDIALTPDGRTLMLVSGEDKQPPKIQLIPADETLSGVDVDQSTVALDNFRLRVDPGAEWQNMFIDAWRLHRDHFYDPGFHGVDWTAVRERYRPLLQRINDRSDLDDLLGQMVGELNALHSQLRSSEHLGRDNSILVARLGARLIRQPGGFLIDRLYEGDTDLAEERSPLSAPNLDARTGDLIVAVNGQSLSDQPDLSALLANQADRQVLLTLKRKDRLFQIVVTACNAKQDEALRLRAWERERADIVARNSQSRIGYLHMRAMGKEDIARFTRDFFAQTDKDGLIIDMRRNLGGKVDSWVFSALLREVGMFWSDHGKASQGNMQQSFRGHIVVLCDEFTYSDGETFSQGIKALALGPLIGTRTAGAGVWLSDNDRLADNGLQRTAERTYFDMKGDWLVGNQGVTPDINVVNMPVATFNGHDQQLEKAIETLHTMLGEHPVAPMVPRSFSSGSETKPH